MEKKIFQIEEETLNEIFEMLIKEVVEESIKKRMDTILSLWDDPREQDEAWITLLNEYRAKKEKTGILEQ